MRLKYVVYLISFTLLGVVSCGKTIRPTGVEEIQYDTFSVLANDLDVDTVSSNTVVSENSLGGEIDITEQSVNNLVVEVSEVDSDTYNNDFPFRGNRDISQPYLNKEADKWVILDTDLNTDVDDVCAVRMATALDELGVIDLKAVCYCVDNSSISALRGLLHHDGKDDVLIGQGTEDREDASPYWEELGKHYDEGGDVAGAVHQYRRVLAEATSPVDIVTVGYLTNLEALLKSEPDDISPLSGVDLVHSKVGKLYIAGSEYPDGWSNNLALTNAAIVATKYVAENWGLPIIWSPSNLSGIFTCGGYLQDLDISRKDPVTRALDAWGVSRGRAAWDPYIMWVCGYGASEVNRVELQRVTFGIQDGGASWFIDGEGKDFIVRPINPDINYYNQTMDNHLIYMHSKIYGIENPNKEPIGR